MPLLQMPITDACDQIWPSGKREAARDEHSSSEHRDLDMSLNMLYWTTLPCGVGHYPVQSELFFVQLEGFLVSQSRIPVNLLVE